MAASKDHPISRIVSNFYVRLVFAGVLIVGGAFYMGQLDQGEINVAQTVEEAQTTGNDGVSADNVASIPEAFRNMQNGGLVPQDPNAATTPAQQPEPEPEPEPVGTTTEETVE